jgi:hypothetical protein
MDSLTRADLERFAAIDPAELDAIREQRGYLSLYLEEANREILTRERELDQRLAAIRDRSGQAIGRLLSSAPLDPKDERDAIRLQGEIRKHLEQRESDAAATTLERLETLAGGGEAKPQPAPTRMTQIPEKPAPLRLSTIARKALEAQSTYPAPETLPQALREPPGWDWDAERLAALAAQALAFAKTGGDRGEPADAEVARGAYLAMRAKQCLMGNESHDALVFFRDAYAWSMEPPNGLPEPARWRQDCAWGLLLATALAFSPKEDRDAVIAPTNLAALFHGDLGRLALGAMDDRGLFSDLAHILLSMTPETMERFLREHLWNHIGSHPIALQDLMRGLASDFPEMPGRVLAVVANLMAEFGDDAERGGAASLRALAARCSATQGDPRQVRHLCDEALRGLQPHCGISGLAEAAREGLESRVAALADSPVPRVTVQVVSGKNGFSSRDRLVLRLHYPRGADILRRVRIEPRLDLAQTESAGGLFERPTAIGRLNPNDTAEVAIRYQRPPNLPGPATLKINVTRWDATEGVTLPVEVHGERTRFAVTPDVPPGAKPLNPYVVGRAIKDIDRIFGRQEEIEEIVRRLVGERQDNVVLVLGDRRIGKTTVLNHLREHRAIKERYICVFSDLQSAGDFRDSAVFYRAYLIDPIRHALKDNRLEDIQAPSATAWSEAPHKAFETFMAAVDRAVGRAGKRLLVLLDELEKVLVADERRRDRDQPEAELPDEALAAIRAVLLASRSVSFVLAGVTDVVRRHIEGPQNRLFNLALSVELRRLEPNAARRLIAELAAPHFVVTTLAQKRIAAETGNHPYLLQYVCFEIFEWIIREGELVATEADVLRAIEQDVIPKAQPFGYVVETLRDRNDLVVLDALAALHAGAGYVCVKDLLRHLRRKGLEWSEDDLVQRLDSMCRQAPSLFVQQKNRPSRYRIEVPLVARHRKRLQQSRTSLVVRTPTDGG